MHCLGEACQIHAANIFAFVSRSALNLRLLDSLAHTCPMTICMLQKVGSFRIGQYHADAEMIAVMFQRVKTSCCNNRYAHRIAEASRASRARPGDFRDPMWVQVSLRELAWQAGPARP